MLQHIDHVNLVVRDLDAMTVFYRDVLGMNVTKRVTIQGEWIEKVVGLKGVVADVIYLDLSSGPRIELIQYRSPAPPKLDLALLGQPHTLGLRHLAFRVEDIDQTSRDLASKGVKFFGPPQQVPDAQVTYAGGIRKRLVYFHDPEGNLLELCEYR